MCCIEVVITTSEFTCAQCLITIIYLTKARFRGMMHIWMQLAALHVNVSKCVYM